MKGVIFPTKVSPPALDRKFKKTILDAKRNWKKNWENFNNQKIFYKSRESDFETLLKQIEKGDFDGYIKTIQNKFMFLMDNSDENIKKTLEEIVKNGRFRMLKFFYVFYLHLLPSINQKEYYDKITENLPEEGWCDLNRKMFYLDEKNLKYNQYKQICSFIRDYMVKNKRLQYWSYQKIESLEQSTTDNRYQNNLDKITNYVIIEDIDKFNSMIKLYFDEWNEDFLFIFEMAIELKKYKFVRAIQERFWYNWNNTSKKVLVKAIRRKKHHIVRVIVNWFWNDWNIVINNICTRGFILSLKIGLISLNKEVKKRRQMTKKLRQIWRRDSSSNYMMIKTWKRFYMEDDTPWVMLNKHKDKVKDLINRIKKECNLNINELNDNISKLERDGRTVPALINKKLKLYKAKMSFYDNLYIDLWTYLDMDEELFYKNLIRDSKIKNVGVATPT